jgi:hypothetical protein
VHPPSTDLPCSRKEAPVYSLAVRRHFEGMGTGERAFVAPWGGASWARRRYWGGRCTPVPSQGASTVQGSPLTVLLGVAQAVGSREAVRTARLDKTIFL